MLKEGSGANHINRQLVFSPLALLTQDVYAKDTRPGQIAIKIWSRRVLLLSALPDPPHLVCERKENALIPGNINEIGSDERVVEIEIERLREFRNHPFKIKADQQMLQLMESIGKYGILNPLIVRPIPEGVYEIISGHRRKFAVQQLGYRKLPVIVFDKLIPPKTALLACL